MARTKRPISAKTCRTVTAVRGPSPRQGLVSARETQYESLVRSWERPEGGPSMNRRVHRFAGGSIVLLVLAALLISPAHGYSQTQGIERRQTRRENRDDARATRQAGRHAARAAKQDR